MITLPSELEIEIVRVFKAPARVVFDMWTKPEHVRKWYGVRGTTVTVCEIDLRVGGACRFVVTRPPALEIAFSGVFREIDPPRRLQRTEVYEGMPGAESILTQTFEEKDGETTMTLNMRFPNKQARDMALKSGMELGIRECFEKMDELLA